MKNKELLIFLGLGIVILLFGVLLSPQQKNIQNEKVPSPEKRNIIVTSPYPNEKVKLPLTIKGKARVFENQLNYRLRDLNKNIILEGTAYANSPDIGQFGDFKIQVTSLPVMRSIALTFEVFDYSAKDGQEIDTISIPVAFVLENAIHVNIFFSSKHAKSKQECTTVFPVERLILNTQTPAHKAVEELLQGPMVVEKNNGYYTNINDGVKIQELTIFDGVAHVDFNKKLEEEVSGSCKVTAIRQQIIETLKQFSTIKEVIISINGRTKDILQP